MQQNDSLANGCRCRVAAAAGSVFCGRHGAGGASRRCGAVSAAIRPVVLAAGETVILLHPPLPLLGVSILMEGGRQQNDRSLANG